MRIITYAPKPCRRCGKTFVPDGANSRWCSGECRRGVSTCGHCRRAFVPTRKSKGLFCSTECYYEQKVPTGTTKITEQGYLIRKVPRGTVGTMANKKRTTDRWMLEHRYVMQVSLGRPLTRRETVHHKNGARTDNRIENLELWKGTHGTGIRAHEYHCRGCRCFD